MSLFLGRVFLVRYKNVLNNFPKFKPKSLDLKYFYPLYNMKVTNSQSIIDINFSLEDLKPAKRLGVLQKISANIQVDPLIPIKKYFSISEGFLVTAKQYAEKGNNELALLRYLRYKELLKKMKKHPKYKDIPIGKRSVFEYKLKYVATVVKKLRQTVFKEYETMYNMARISIEFQDFESGEEQRATISTVKTFVSGPGSLKKRYEGDISKSLASQNRLSIISANIVRDSNFQYSKEYLNFSLRSKTDTLIGLRKIIFPSKQVREFEAIHGQRRKVRSHRTLRIPSRTTTEFSYLSFKNMKMNVETVGYLAGKEIDADELLVTHLIIPEQIGYSDYFKVKDSYVLIRYLEINDLLILGWIHSHPVTKPYLSSSDMHYQSIFQSVLPEAVAIVYSPLEMKSTIFNLTPDHGLEMILNCRKKGFHIHPTIPPVTMISQHAVIERYGDLLVKDFRDSKKPLQEKKTKISEETLERTIRSKSSEFYRYRKSEVAFVHIS